MSTPTQNNERTPRLSGLLPVGVFLVLFIGTGVVLGDFYAMPAIVAFLVALCVAFAQSPKIPFEEKLSHAAASMGDQNVMIMCLVFVLAGAFSGAASAAGGVTSTVNLALSVLPAQIIVAGLFLIACFISISMGTSVGTIAALAPIAAGVAQTAEFSGALCLGAVVGGAMFGDNLSMISDTTIAATRTQGARMDDKFKENFKIALPAAVVAFVFFLVAGSSSHFTPSADLTYNVWQVIPYLVVLITALFGLNVFAVLIIGSVLSLIVGVATGMIEPLGIFSALAGGADGKGGIMNMYDITVISIVCAGIIGLVKQNGGIDWILARITKFAHSRRGGSLSIAALGALVDVSTANNTVAIVMAGPIAKDISETYGISPRKSASILDIFTSVMQGIIPYGAQILYASAGAASIGLAVTPFEIVPMVCYPFALAACALIYIIFFSGRTEQNAQ